MARVMLLAGGPSSEHEVSLSSSRELLRLLRERRHEACPVWISRDTRFVVGAPSDALDDVVDRSGGRAPSDVLPAWRRRGDVAFLGLHGPFGEDGTVQRLLEEAGVSYTGSGPAASELCMDKALTKLAVARLGGRCAKHEVLSGGRHMTWGIGKAMGYPCIVKPVGAGSSVGLSLVHSQDELSAAVRAAQAADPSGRCMVEEYIRGREVTCAVLRRAGALVTLPLVAILPAGPLYDYEAKYHSPATRYECPAAVPPDTAREIEDVSRALYEGLALRGAARIDFLVEPEGGRPVFLEANTLPGFTDHSLVPMAARAAGWTAADVVDAILADASVPMAAQEGA